MPIGPAAIFSPDPALIESYTHIDHEDVSNITKPRDNLILYKDIPYSQYLGEWQFHPNRIGAYLAATKISPELLRIATKVLVINTQARSAAARYFMGRFSRNFRSDRKAVSPDYTAQMAVAWACRIAPVPELRFSRFPTRIDPPACP